MEGMAKKLGRYEKKRDFERTPEPRGGDGSRRRRPLRRPAARRHPPALGPAARARGRAGLVGAAARDPRPPGREPAGGAHRGPPARVPRVRRRDPQGRVRRGHDGDLGPRAATRPEKFRENEVIAVFHGERVKGRYALFRTRGDDWMIHRMDPPEDPDYEPMPDRIAPMQAQHRRAAARRRSLGLRGQVGRHPRGHVRRPRPHDASGPQLQRLHAPLPGAARARPRPGRARGSCSTARSSPSTRRAGRASSGSSRACTWPRTPRCRRRMRDIPATYVIFDLLYLDGPLDARAALRGAPAAAPRARAPGPVLAHARPPRGRGRRAPRGHQGAGGRGHRGQEARLAPTSRAGAARCWLKIKNVPQPGRRDRRLHPRRGAPRAAASGALAVGYYDEGRARATPARSGTGFTEQTLALLSRELTSLRREESPFDGRQPPKGTIFVEPELVAHVEFREWTRSGTLRAPSFKGLRADVDPAEVGREPQVSAR